MDTKLNPATASTSTSTSLARRAMAGVIGGVAGGIVFGMMMAMMGMLPTLAMMVGSESPVVGFLIHMMISIGIGLGLTVLFGSRLLTSYLRGLIVGLVYGAIWWVLGPLVLMPMMLGGALFAINVPALLSLMGHLIYGAILGVVAVRVLSPRR
ncbi:hypothetical protein [Salinibacterium sp. PAMC 21357]|uniref:hypothetical protein n=1 Tax=Salinibacterium sp. PAMC 21357 TaxID=1112215 RepID=UPI0002E5D35F|nr:hypothetical protein [Salinibacterium sp. PAMC 21357]